MVPRIKIITSPQRLLFLLSNTTLLIKKEKDQVGLLNT